MATEAAVNWAIKDGKRANGGVNENKWRAVRPRLVSWISRMRLRWSTAWDAFILRGKHGVHPGLLFDRLKGGPCMGRAWLDPLVLGGVLVVSFGSLTVQWR